MVLSPHTKQIFVGQMGDLAPTQRQTRKNLKETKKDPKTSKMKF